MPYSVVAAAMRCHGFAGCGMPWHFLVCDPLATASAQLAEASIGWLTAQKRVCFRKGLCSNGTDQVCEQDDDMTGHVHGADQACQAPAGSVTVCTVVVMVPA